MSGVRRRPVAAALSALAVAAVACSSGPAARPSPVWRADYQVWNEGSPLRRPLPSDARVHPDSRRMIADLYGACGKGTTGPCKFPRLAGLPDRGEFFASYGAPIFVAEPGERARTLRCVRFACGVQGLTGEDTRAFYGVPIPVGARPEPSDDGHMIVHDPERGVAWELFRAVRSDRTGRWTAEGGIRWNTRGPGTDEIGEPGFAVGAGIPMIGTIVRPEEVKRALEDGTGVIPHPLSGGYDSPRPGCFIGPLAKDTDADDGRRWSIPEGAILQLDPALDLSELGLSAAERVIARTLQVYGMVVRDDTGAFQIDVENVSVEDAAHPGRARLWAELGVRKDGLQPLQGNLFRVIAWSPTQAHGDNCS